ADSIETDLHFCRNGEIVLYHDARLSRRICCRFLNQTKRDLTKSPRLARLHSSALRRIVAERNPEPQRFPEQRPERTPLSTWFARERFREPHDPYTLPLLNQFFEFINAYASSAGAEHGKTVEQRANAERIILDLEIKNEP